ncbi:hypothetical protein KSS87_001461 [Heliosperma pusillum]|nr:hypothetical protein KSS87_001461 [Heliosperma pusillum]
MLDSSVVNDMSYKSCMIRSQKTYFACKILCSCIR